MNHIKSRHPHLHSHHQHQYHYTTTTTTIVFIIIILILIIIHRNSKHQHNPGLPPSSDGLATHAVSRSAYAQHAWIYLPCRIRFPDPIHCTHFAVTPLSRNSVHFAASRRFNSDNTGIAEWEQRHDATTAA